MTSAGTTPQRVQVRAPRDIAEFRTLEELQLRVWGFDEREAVPASHMRAVQHAGGMVLGAYHGGETVGFAYGFPALPAGPWERGAGLHSHMVAVAPGRQGLGVGRVLKWAQRSWCLERGLRWMTWTFDPMQGRNARLNFHYLGVRSREYLVDFYGTMAGELGGGQPSDRLLVHWDLDADDVAQLGERSALGLGPEPQPLPARAWILVRKDAGGPEPRAVPAAGPLRVAVPEDTNRLFQDEPGVALAWRLAIREAIAPALARGYMVTGFGDGGYLLERPPDLTT